MERIPHLITGALAAALLTTGSALAETTLRFANWVPETSQPTPAFQEWAKSITEDSNGRIKVEFYNAQQLGNARDHYNIARDGIADVAWAVPSFEPGRFPVFSVMEIPFMTRNAALASGAFHEWYRGYAEKEMSEVKFCAITMAPQGTMNFSNKKVTSLSEIKGMKLRPAGTFVSEYFTNAGAVAVAVPASEARQSFERGLIEGIAFPWRTLIPFGLEKSVKYHMDMIFYAVPAAVVLNKGTYEGMSAEDKAVIDSHCTPEWSVKINTIWQDWELEGRQILTGMGNEIYSISDAQAKEWLDASLPLRDSWVSLAEKAGVADGAAALDQLLDGLNAADAGY